ncbi:hypothetical protein HMPREF1221_01722 [Treponema socranskii subsp. paredis ATCC 35535]|nr:hypothetical protein HMPREF1221_01722 [Treponema socranskii subsp. paredis ATCC 35535]
MEKSGCFRRFRKLFFRGFPASGGSGYPLQSPSAISASIPNPYAGSRTNCICTTNSHRAPFAAYCAASIEKGNVRLKQVLGVLFYTKTIS